MSSPSSILVVEDDADTQELIREALASQGYSGELHVKDDGESALDWILIAARPPDLVLLDVQLPGMNGLTVLERIRSSGAAGDAPRVVMFSGTTDSAVIGKAWALGADDFVSKPAEYTGMKLAVKRIVDRWLRPHDP